MYQAPLGQSGVGVLGAQREPVPGAVYQAPLGQSGVVGGALAWSGVVGGH